MTELACVCPNISLMCVIILTLCNCAFSKASKTTVVCKLSIAEATIMFQNMARTVVINVLYL